jgi:hypothetical protein
VVDVYKKNVMFDNIKIGKAYLGFTTDKNEVDIIVLDRKLKKYHGSRQYGGFIIVYDVPYKEMAHKKIFSHRHRKFAKYIQISKGLRKVEGGWGVMYEIDGKKYEELRHNCVANIFNCLVIN